VNTYSAVANWAEGFDEKRLQAWAEELGRKLEPQPVSLGLVFLGPRFFEHAQQVLELLQVHARIPLLVGCSSQGHIAGDRELEDNAGLTLGLYSLPGAQLKPFRFAQEQIEEANGPGYWQLETGVEPEQCNGWLAFVDPFRTDAESWLRTLNEAYAPAPVRGGLASGGYSGQRTQLYLNGQVFEEGGVAVCLGGAVKLAGITSQGCTPIGETWTLTKVEGNIIHEIANRRAYDVLLETFNSLSPDEQQKTRGNLFIGLVVNEYLEEFHRGDFLIRNLMGVDPRTGSIAVGAWPRVGQTMQFQRRSASAATEDFKVLIERAQQQLAGATVYGACLCCCNGRGQNLFGEPDHDARMVAQSLGPIGVSGFFCNGEIGPVGEKNFLHGYTASLALFVSA